ncbi:DUF4229 domain-containing protein [Nocardiopsis baichengensis]|uniref:DUF4229 domain-containing protein n=1 Tax=Nocardiopsis baichengensis TaxID=280240 RepID=UPI00034C5D11|nr:DUF4229 domain-containing protein [Nocardiopsis baichengensis]
MRSVLAYTAARLLLFGVAFGLLYLLGARGALALILAALVSGLVSYIVLSRQRDAVSERITARTDRMSRRLEEGAAHEDAAQAAGAAPRPAPSPKAAGSGRAGAEDADGAGTTGAGNGDGARPEEQAPAAQ